MKNLLKEWQLLVQKSVEKNGIVSNAVSDNSTSHILTPPPSVPVMPTATVSSICSGEKKPNSPLSNRKLLLSRFSAIKQTSMPQATPTTLSLTSSSPSTYSSLIAPPNNVTKLSLSSSTTPTPISNGTKPIESLTVRFPLERLPREQDVSSLVVSISLALISFPSRRSLIEPAFQPEVNVMSPLIVQIKRSLLSTPQSISPVHFPLPSKPISSSLLPNATNETVECTHIIPGAPSGRLKSDNVPEFCTAGIDGCLGADGMWYEWTDVMPHDEPVVTILPYVYIDGLELLSDL